MGVLPVSSGVTLARPTARGLEAVAHVRFVEQSVARPHLSFSLDRGGVVELGELQRVGRLLPDDGAGQSAPLDPPPGARDPAAVAGSAVAGSIEGGVKRDGMSHGAATAMSSTKLPA